MGGTFGWLYDAYDLVAGVVGAADGTPLAHVRAHSTREVRVDPTPAETRRAREKSGEH